LASASCHIAWTIVASSVLDRVLGLADRGVELALQLRLAGE
jgi:hypothetical protein